MLEYQNKKTFLLKNILQNGRKKFLWLKKLKILFHGHMLILISMVKKLLKAEVDKLDIDKLVPVPVDLSKLNDL